MRSGRDFVVRACGPGCFRMTTEGGFPGGLIFLFRVSLLFKAYFVATHPSVELGVMQTQAILL